VPELELQVNINETLPRELTVGQVAYQDRPGASALIQFHRDLILGRPLDLTLGLQRIERLADLVAVALFLRRDLAIHPKMTTFVAASDLASLGAAGLAHAEPDECSFLRFLRDYLVGQKLGKPEVGRRLYQAVEWIGDYILDDRLPNLRPEPEPPRVLDVGTNGFVVALVDRPELVEDDWIPLYRQGHLRGVVFTPPTNDARGYLGARKSLFLEFSLDRASVWLNEAERSLRGPEDPRWEAQGDWLWGPATGTLLPPSAVVDVLVRV